MSKKLLALFLVLGLMAYAEDTIELDQTTVKGSKTSDYTAPPKEQKNTFVITQERIREKNYKNVEDILRDAPGVVVQNTAFGPRIDMRGSGEKSLSRVKVLVDGISINPTEETMASLPINAIPVESIKKIEIIPGGGATLYGSGSGRTGLHGVYSTNDFGQIFLKVKGAKASKEAAKSAWKSTGIRLLMYGW